MQSKETAGKRWQRSNAVPFVAEIAPPSSWGWRKLWPQELLFIQTHFGHEQASWLHQRVRLGLRRLGDTRRALCLNGGWLSFPRAFYGDSQPRQPLRLDHPVVAGVFAHELLHELQRRHGLAVTRQALVLQCQWLLQGKNPYLYSCSGNAVALVRQFWRATVEQQGQMWQDYVQAQVAGRPLASHALLPGLVRAGRLQPRNGKSGA